MTESEKLKIAVNTLEKIKEYSAIHRNMYERFLADSALRKIEDKTNKPKYEGINGRSWSA